MSPLVRRSGRWLTTVLVLVLLGACVPAAVRESCGRCHGVDDAARNPHYPRLAGQHPGYLVQQLRLFSQGRRGGSPYAQIMRLVASRLTEEQMTQVADWYGSLQP